VVAVDNMSLARRTAALPPVGHDRYDTSGHKSPTSATRVRSSSVGGQKRQPRDVRPLRACGAGLVADCGTSAAPAKAVVAAGKGSAGIDGLDSVLFLDVDGVLHSLNVTHPRQQFNAACMELLREVLTATSASVVLSTSWRLHTDARRELAEKLVEHGLPQFVSRTPSIAQFHRAREIFAWVRRHRPRTWVAVDDWPLEEENSEITGHFVRTRPCYGLQRDTADRIIELFKHQAMVAAGDGCSAGASIPANIRGDTTPGPVKVIIYDFDQTISREHVYHNLRKVGKAEKACTTVQLENIERSQWIAWYGGEERLDRIREHLDELKGRGAILYIASFGWHSEVSFALRLFSLDKFFTAVVGVDTCNRKAKPFPGWGYYKYKQIQVWTQAQDLSPHHVLFVDDDRGNIDDARKSGACHTLTISKRKGMTGEQMQQIASWQAGRPLEHR